MDNLGQYLHALREEKSLSVADVNRDIKLTTGQIDAIETNQLHKLGNHGIARAMVYSYIRYLGADEKHAMYMFDLVWPPQKQNMFKPQKPIKEKKVLISTNFIWLIGIILIVIVLGSITWISYTKGYLKRPFDSIKKSQDSVKTELVVTPKAEQPDTLRKRMLQIARTPLTAKATNDKGKQTKSKVKKSAFSDTTDYINGLIFDSKDSPFNANF